MPTPAFLVRLMQHGGLSAQATRRLGPEDREACQFAADLRKLTLEGRIKAVWFHPANELIGTAGKVHAAIARCLGLHRGVCDYIFMCGSDSIAIEFKSKTGPLSPYQEDFERWCNLNHVPFILVRSVAEAMETLINFGILTDAKAY